MLRWRFLLGTLIVAALVGICWADIHAPTPGLYLMPVVLLAAVLGTRELLDLAAAVGIHPVRWPIYLGNIMAPLFGWFCWTAKPSAKDIALGCTSWKSDLMSPGFLIFVFSVAVLLFLYVEMRRYRQESGGIAKMATGVFTLLYVGLMLSIAVRMRVIYGIGAIAMWVITVKMCDSGAYFTGRLLGRHKLAPTISPGKTVEGVIGGLAFACLGSWLTFQFIVPYTIDIFNVKPGPWWGWIVFGWLVGGAGIFGDLVESLIKRDAGRKDSSDWMPGFGGVLDMLDSLLLSAPVAWFCWASGIFGLFD